LKIREVGALRQEQGEEEEGAMASKPRFSNTRTIFFAFVMVWRIVSFHSEKTTDCYIFFTNQSKQFKEKD